MAAAGVLGFISLLLLVEAAVFGIASFGIALHWSCLIVAAAIALLAGVAFLKGRADAREEMTPTRTIHHIKQAVMTNSRPMLELKSCLARKSATN